MLRVLFRLVPVFILSLALTLPLTTHALTLSQRLKGRILLQTEKNGEAWYVRPDNQLRLYMGRPSDAFYLMRSLGLGISDSDLKKIPIGILPGELGGRDADDDGIYDQLEQLLGYDWRGADTDGDGYNDLQELNSGNDPLKVGTRLPIDIKLTKKLHGKILLQTEQNGEAWYVYPDDSKRYYLGRPNDAFFIMRSLGLGISNIDLAKISEGRVPPVETGEQVASSSDVTSSWQSYYNQKYGFSFHYPSDIMAGERDPAKGYIPAEEAYFVTRGYSGKGDVFNAGMSANIRVFPNSTMSLDDAVTSEYPTRKIATTNTIIGGNPARRVLLSDTDDHEGPYGFEAYIVKKGSILYVIAGVTNFYPPSESYKKKFEDIVMTLSFQ